MWCRPWTHCAASPQGWLPGAGSSPAAIAAALRDLFSDPERAVRMGRAGARRSQRFGWDRIAAETLAAYRNVLVRRATPAPALKVQFT